MYARSVHSYTHSITANRNDGPTTLRTALGLASPLRLTAQRVCLCGVTAAAKRAIQYYGHTQLYADDGPIAC